MLFRLTAPTLTTLRLALVGCASLAGVSLAMADPPTAISGASPFGGCTADNMPGQPGTNYPGAEVEPWADVNPTNSNNVIAAWQQDRWSNGGSRGLMSGYSSNGGTTWTPVLVPGISLCSGGTFERASDPWVTISPNGAAYFMSLSFMNDEPSGAGGDNAMLVNRSTDGGASWSAPQALIFDTDGQIFNDKNSMTADPTDSNYVYAVWDRLDDLALPHAGKPNGHVAHGGDGVVNARQRREDAINRGGTVTNTRSYTGPAYFARTSNGGVSWETAKPIFDPGTNSQTIANQVVVLKNGNVADFFTEIDHNGQTSIGIVKSTDNGATFGPRQTAIKTNITRIGTLTPDAKQGVRDANILFDVAVDRDNGNLYLVWQDGRSQNIDRVAFSMSTNNGASWSTPAIIAKTPYSSNKLRMQSFIPSVEVMADHRLAVTYYDFRNDTAVGGEMTDYWAITCDPTAGNCRLPSDWGNEQQLTAASFDMLNAPEAFGHFLGDYQGLVKQGTGARAVFAVTVAPNQNDIVTAFIP